MLEFSQELVKIFEFSIEIVHILEANVRPGKDKVRSIYLYFFMQPLRFFSSRITNISDGASQVHLVFSFSEFAFQARWDLPAIHRRLVVGKSAPGPAFHPSR